MSIISNIRSIFGAKSKEDNTVPNVNSLDELHELAKKYLYGDGLHQNLSLAIMYLEFAAQKGHAESLRTLGVCYSEGLGVEQSFEKAFELYQKAAESGLVDAYFDLGVCYRRGEGVEMRRQSTLGRAVLRRTPLCWRGTGFPGLLPCWRPLRGLRCQLYLPLQGWCAGGGIFP